VSRPGISVLLPCRDAETTLAECIESLCLQTLPDFEVIAVDDCSADRTREILDRWAAHDDRVTVIGGSGSGVADALALAAERAEADLLARMDADDIAHPERLALQNRFMLERRDIAACGTGVRYFPRAILGSGYVRYEDWLNSLHEPADIDPRGLRSSSPPPPAGSSDGQPSGSASRMACHAGPALDVV
jgi:glycosyltransferase involved in cell wall biosynthesis